MSGHVQAHYAFFRAYYMLCSSSQFCFYYAHIRIPISGVGSGGAGGGGHEPP